MDVRAGTCVASVQTSHGRAYGDTHFGTIYDADQLARNEVPLQAAVYFDDMYVDSGLQLDTLSRVGRSHYWTTNEFEHDGVHGATVFRHLFNEVLNRGDLAELF